MVCVVAWCMERQESLGELPRLGADVERDIEGKKPSKSSGAGPQIRGEISLQPPLDCRKTSVSGNPSRRASLIGSCLRDNMFAAPSGNINYSLTSSGLCRGIFRCYLFNGSLASRGVHPAYPQDYLDPQLGLTVLLLSGTASLLPAISIYMGLAVSREPLLTLRNYPLTLLGNKLFIQVPIEPSRDYQQVNSRLRSV